MGICYLDRSTYCRRCTNVSQVDVEVRASSLPLGDSSLMLFTGVQKFLGGSCGGRLTGSVVMGKQKGKRGHIFNSRQNEYSVINSITIAKLEHAVLLSFEHQVCELVNCDK